MRTSRVAVSDRVPSSTYRFQLRTPSSDPEGRSVTFADVAAAVPMLVELGVDAVYLSPCFTSVAGSTHGYDVIDPNVVHPELGGIEGLRRLRRISREAGIKLVIDIVPNHVGVADARQNRWWWDALRFGPASEYYMYFDFDDKANNGADGKIALPILGDPGDIDQLELVRELGPDGTEQEMLRIYDQHFPVDPATLGGTAQQVHERQVYRLVHWREPVIGYRRFFTVKELAGLRQEFPDVFAATHAGVAQLVAEDLVDGVRVDHPDGLADPLDYTRLLREVVGPDRWIVIEKILGPGELLDPSLPVDGTTGYDTLATIDHLLLDAGHEHAMTELAARYVGEVISLPEAKRQVCREGLAPEIARLVRTVTRAVAYGFDPEGIPGGVPDPERIPMELLPDPERMAEAICEVVAATPYYRGDYPSMPHVLEQAFEDAQRARPGLRPELATLSQVVATSLKASTRLAQVTGAATAKAEEDCRFYRLGRLVALNEVGGHPSHWNDTVTAFHAHMAARAIDQPAAMTTLSTHDTKRGEDVRARILALSNYPEAWERFVTRIFELAPPPALDSGYFLLQAIVGVWPVKADPSVREELRERLHAYADKASREAALHTTWTEQNTEFENALHAWIDTLIDSHREVVNEFAAFIDAPGKRNSLVAKALQLMGPGVPDVYQGSQVWEDTLVDPDNRRFVDYDEGLDGHPKTDLVRAILEIRQSYPDAFVGGAYVPLGVFGPAEGSVVAFARGSVDEEGDGHVAGVVIARLRARDAEQYLPSSSVLLPEGHWELVYGPAVQRGSMHRGRTLFDLYAALREEPVVVLRNHDGP